MYIFGFSAYPQKIRQKFANLCCFCKKMLIIILVLL